MSNIVTVLKAEISRIARKEAKAAATTLRKPIVASRGTLDDLKRRVAALEIENKRMAALLSKLPQPESKVEPAKAKGWISGKGVSSLRQKLGLSRMEFAQLLKVTPKAVYKWESKPGMLRLREHTRAALLATRQLGTREARAKLGEMAAAKKAQSAGKAKK